MDRSVFPDGELHEIGGVVSSLQRAGFELAHVESLRDHYTRTLRCWVANLERSPAGTGSTGLPLRPDWDTRAHAKSAGA